MDAVDASLRRLQIDYIDLYQIHGNDVITPIEETLRALDTLVNNGRSVTSASPTGKPGRSPRLSASPVQGLARFDTLQAYYSIAGATLSAISFPSRSGENRPAGLEPSCRRLLSGKFSRENPKPEGTRRSEFDFPIVDKERAWKILDAIAPIAKAHNCSPARVSLAWLLAKPVVTSVIIGAKRLDQLTDNLAAVDLTLSTEEIKLLDDVSALPPEYPGWMLPFQGANRLKDVPVQPSNRSNAQDRA